MLIYFRRAVCAYFLHLSIIIIIIVLERLDDTFVRNTYIEKFKMQMCAANAADTFSRMGHDSRYLCFMRTHEIHKYVEHIKIHA